MRNPNSPVARDIDGAANVITAAICKLTNGQPAGVLHIGRRDCGCWETAGIILKARTRLAAG